MRDPALAAADFQAQVAASASGERALLTLLDEYGPERFQRLCRLLNAYAEQLASAALAELPRGRYCAEDAMDDDGAGGEGPVLRVAVEIDEHGLHVDFAGTDAAVPGNLNCPLSVTAAAAFYVLRCLLPDRTPACAGAMAPLRLEAAPGSLVHAQRPSATAAGNVETSQRIVDVLLRALSAALPERIPAASQGTMNNVGLGSSDWSYYETQAGGCGATAARPGRSAVHSHMTNTLNTPAEVLERHFPLRLVEYRIRRGSGGDGRCRGGDGLIRTFEFLAPAEVTLITERRRLAPWGLQGGRDGQPGVNLLDGEPLPAKVGLRVRAGQRLRVETPGGGGFSVPEA
jgi:N-methylhydantoinase B